MRCDTISQRFNVDTDALKTEILLVSELVRPRAVSWWVWVCTVVIYDHDLGSHSTRYHYQKPIWSPVRSNPMVIRHIRDEKKSRFWTSRREIDRLRLSLSLLDMLSLIPGEHGE